MKQYIHGFWRQTKGRCQRCFRSRDKMYEIREGPVIGRFCGRFCYEQMVEEKEAKKGTVEGKVEELKKKQEESVL